MRIAISCHPTQGGSGIVATELARALAANGHQVHVISCDRPFRLPETENVLYHPVNIPDYPLFTYPPHDLSLINKLQEVVLAYNIDVVHAHYAIPHAICAILAREIIKPHSVKVVATMHGTDITLVGSHPDFYDVCKYAMVQSDGLTVVSNWLKNRTVEEFRLDFEPDVIHNFIDPVLFNDQGHVGYPDNGEFLIMHASNFRPVKRITDIIRVFHRIQQNIPAKLVLLGKGPELGLARELCAELGICGKIIFAGSHTDIQTYFKKAHLFLLLSAYESFGLAALEAMACGVPVAVSNAGGLPEIVTHGVTGLLCDGNNSEETARLITQLLTDKTRWCRMSQSSAQHVRKNFTAAAVVPQYEKLYETILGQERTPA